MFGRFQKAQPVSITGALRHCWLWLTSSSGDVIYRNPNHKLPSSTENASDDSTAIYCIHGTADRVSAFTLIANRLVDDLPENISTINLVSFDNRAQGTGIEQFAHQLLEKIRAANHKKVILMGHSRGALVAAYLTEYLAKNADIQVEAVFAIGGPFAGSDLALPPLSWYSTSVKQMEKDSEFCKALVDKIKESDVPYFYYAAENDSLVPIDSAHIPEHKASLVILDRHGHLSIMSSHRLVKHIRSRLESILHPESSHNPETDPSSASESRERQSEHPIAAVCNEIAEQIRILGQSYHVWSPAAKIQVLKQLQARLEEMLDGTRGDYYPDAVSIGGFISAFMQDEKINNNIKPVDTLNEALNYPLSIFQGPYAGSRIFIEDLIRRYNEILLPEKVKTNANTL